MDEVADDVQEAVELMAPQVKLAKWVVWAVLGLIAAVFAGWVLWKLFFAQRAATAKHDRVQAETEGRVGKAQGDAGAHAANAVANQGGKETIIRETTRTNTIEITKQPGAGDPVSDAVDGAGRHAICLRASAAGLPDCQRLQETNP